MLSSPPQRNQTGTGCGVPFASTVVNQASCSSVSRLAARCPNSLLVSRSAISARPYRDRPSTCNDGPGGKPEPGVTLAIMLTFASALAINWAWIREHDAAAAMPPLSVRRPRESLLLLVRNRQWITGFAAEV